MLDNLFIFFLCTDTRSLFWMKLMNAQYILMYSLVSSRRPRRNARFEIYYHQRYKWTGSPDLFIPDRHTCESAFFTLCSYFTDSHNVCYNGCWSLFPLLQQCTGIVFWRKVVPNKGKMIQWTIFYKENLSFCKLVNVICNSNRL